MSNPDRPYFEHHVFVCENKRGKSDKRGSCGRENAEKLRGYLKDRLKALKIHGKGQHRVNAAGCLDRCELAPVFVIYPEGIWYSPKTKDDVEEILQSHIIGGKVVERLKLQRNQLIT